MIYSENPDLVIERSVRIAIHGEHEKLESEINRMFVTDDISELLELYDIAKKRIDIIYGYHLERVKELQSIIGGIEQCGQ